MDGRHGLGWRWLVLGAALLAGCGGSLSLGFGTDDDAPSVNLAASPQEAAPGALITLVAAASDDYGVAEVRFYRLDSAGATLLGRDAVAPYALETALPATSAAEVRYFARAVDDAGQASDSASVAVLVR